MKDNIHNKSMKQRGIQRDIQRWPKVVLRTAAAYADSKNTDKYNSLTGLNTVIYGNF